MSRTAVQTLLLRDRNVSVAGLRQLASLAEEKWYN